MRNIVTIAEKELGVYLTTVVGYAGFGAYAFLMGLGFVSALSAYQRATETYVATKQPALLEQLNFNDQILVPMFSSGLWLFLFFVPFLTMRLFAEEKSARTFELLMTAPVTTADLVLGKWLAAAAMIGAMTAIPLVFPLILHFYGSSSGSGSPVEWAPVVSGLLAILLMGLTFTSVGLLSSSLSESQVVAALGTFAVLLFGFLLPTIASRIDGDARTLLEYLSPVSHVSRGLQGRVRLSDLVYFGTVNAVLLYFTHRVVESHRWR